MQPGIPALRDLARALHVRAVDALVAAGHLRPTDLGAHPRTAEESITTAPGLTERQRAELLGYLAAMRNRTGYTEPPGSARDAASDDVDGTDVRDGTG